MMIRRQLHPYPLSLPHTDPPWRKALFLVNQTASEIYTTVHLSRRFPVNMARLGRVEGNDTGPPFVEDRDSSKAYKHDKFGEAYSKGLDEAKEPYLSRHGGGKDPYSNGNEESQQPYLSDYAEDNGPLRNGYGDYVHVYTDLASYSKWKLGYVTPSAYTVRDEPCEREEDMLRSKEMSELNASEESGENSISNAYTKKTEVLTKNLYEEREDTPAENSGSSRQEDLHKEASLILDAYKVRAEEAYKKAERRDVEEYKNNRFERLMSVGCALLTEGEQGLDGGLEVGIAERMLKEASFIFASASSIDSSNPKPISALGNTLLTRGKLKLLLMEELREIIADSNANTGRYVKSRRANPNRKNQRVNVDDDVYQKGIDGSIRNMIPKVCDDCEGLLVEAGRKYHALLLMNKRDEHAMFCWGQALFFRGRLVGAHDQKVNIQLYVFCFVSFGCINLVFLVYLYH
jgi:hypothetical protein